MAVNKSALDLDATFYQGGSVSNLGFKYSGNTSPIVEFQGTHAVKETLNHYGSNYSYRTEIQPNHLPSDDFNGGMFAKSGHEYWYGVRTYMDDSWKATDSTRTIITQWHAKPDGGNPPVSLMVGTGGDGHQHYTLVVRSDNTSDGSHGADHIKQYDLGEVGHDIGKWTDWVWNIKWSPNGDGHLELWKDGKVVADINGGNSYLGADGPYMKLGLYKWDWHSSADSGADTRTMYFDNVRITGGDGNYDTVNPHEAAKSAAAAQATGADAHPASAPLANAQADANVWTHIATQQSQAEALHAAADPMSFGHVVQPVDLITAVDPLHTAIDHHTDLSALTHAG